MQNANNNKTSRRYSIPIANKPEVTASANTEPIGPEIPVPIKWLPGFGAAIGRISVGYGFFFMSFAIRMSWAIAAMDGPKTVKPKIPITVVSPNKKDFRFYLDFSLYSLNLSLKVLLKG